MIKHLIILSFLFLLINCGDKINMVYYPEEPTFPDSTFQTLAFKLFPLGSMVPSKGKDSRSLKETLRRFEESAKQGSVAAQTALGAIYYIEDDNNFQTTKVVLKDYHKALNYFEDAIDGKYVVTVPHIYIAVMYVLGHGVTKDVERAKGILNNLVTSGHKKAKFLYNFILYASPENSDQVREAARKVIEAHKNDSDLQAARPLIEDFLKNN